MCNITYSFALAMRDALALFGPAATMLAAVHPSLAVTDAGHEDWNVKSQSAYVRQLRQSFAAPYTSPDSLTFENEPSYSFTTPTAAAAVCAYSWGAAVERYRDDWAACVGRFAQPKQPNQIARFHTPGVTKALQTSVD